MYLVSLMNSMAIPLAKLTTSQLTRDRRLILVTGGKKDEKTWVGLAGALYDRLRR